MIKIEEKNGNNPSFDLDEFSLENGFKIDESVYNAPKTPKSKHKKKKSGIKTAVWILSIIIVSVGIAFGAIYAGADYLGIGFGRGGNCEMEIEKGSGTAKIAEKLSEAGAVKVPLFFRVYCKLKHYDGKFQYGFYTFDSELGYDSIAQMLMTEGAVVDSVKVTVKEGATVDDIAKLLEDNKVCTKDDFLDAVENGDYDYDFIKDIPVENVHYRLEGYLFPDTYEMYYYDSEKCAYLAVDKMLSTLDKKLKEEKIDTKNITVMGKNYTFHQIMTMASIVELESGMSKEDMPKVAAVFFNRLNDTASFPFLGSSPTKKYPHGDGKYNTYTHKGLPVGPLCSMGIESIASTVSPSQNFDYLYFVTDKSMKFYYTKTLNEHNNLKARLKAEKNWIYEE